MKSVGRDFRLTQRYMLHFVPAHRISRHQPKKRYPITHGIQPRRSSPYRPVKEHRPCPI